MRRILLVPALALVLLGAPVLALEDPAPPTTTTTSIPLTPEVPETTTTSAVPATTTPTTEAQTPAAEGTVTPGWESAATPLDATLVGVAWEGDPAAEFVVEVQASDGSWDEAHLEAADTGADVGGADAARVSAEGFPANATEPLWVGDDVTAVRVTLESGVASDVEVAAVESEPASAPDGAAGAITGVIGSVDGAGRWVFGAVLLVVVALLVALALGWRPRRAFQCVALVGAAVLLAACVPVAPPPPPPPAPGGSSAYAPRPPMVGRATWGARPFQCAGGPEYAPALKYAVVHHTVNSNGYSPGASPGIVQAIQSYHMDVNGYCDVAYNFLIDRYGTIFIGREGGAKQPVIGGHAGGFNTGSTGIALIGDFTSSQPPGEQWNALVDTLRWRLSVAKLDPSVPTWITVGASPCGCQRWPVGTGVYLDNLIWNHRDLNTTACPGNAFAPRRDELRGAVQPGIKFPQ